MKILVVLGLLVALVAGVGGAYYFMGLEIPFLTDSAPAGKRKKVEPPPPSVFTTMDVIHISVIVGERVHRHVALQIAIDSPGEANARIVRGKLNVLHDAFVRDLTGYVNLQYEESDTANLENIKKRLKLVADRTLGPGAVTEVLVVNMFARKP